MGACECLYYCNIRFSSSYVSKRRGHKLKGYFKVIFPYKDNLGGRLLVFVQEPNGETTVGNYSMYYINKFKIRY